MTEGELEGGKSIAGGDAAAPAEGEFLLTSVNGGLAQRAIARIRKAILTHELPPGVRVSETNLMAQFDLPRASVRAALSFLQQSGFIVSAGSRTQLVAPLTLASIRETFQLRNLLAPAAAQFAIGKVDIVKLRLLNAECVARSSLDDREEGYRYLEANFQFHMEILRATGMPQLQKWLTFIEESVLRILWISLPNGRQAKRLGGGHEEIIQAFERADAAEVAKATLDHLRSGQQLVYDLIMDGAVPLTPSA